MDTIVFTNPFRDAIKMILDKENKSLEKQKELEIEKKKEGERWITSKTVNQNKLESDPKKIEDKIGVSGLPNKQNQKSQKELVPIFEYQNHSTKKINDSFDFSKW